MYLGQIVEIAPALDLYAHPKHPYTEALLSAVPVAKPGHAQRRIKLTGDVPSPIDPPAGCTFHPRCRYAQQSCRQIVPTLDELGNNHMAACFFPVKGGTP
jgi:oligopeptide/dipeptide ABC transporter ATP-binding protein